MLVAVPNTAIDSLLEYPRLIFQQALDKITFYFMLIIGANHIDNAWDLPISMTGLVIALWFFIIWWSTSAFRTHILVIALFTAVISLLPIAGLNSFSTFFLPFHGGYPLVLGLFLTVAGICDHLVLLHTLRDLRRVYHDEAI
jgi:hypothetical protein